MREILNSFSDPFIEQITLCSGTQVGKTTFQLCSLAYAIACDPGPALWVMPNIDMAKRFSEGHIQPLVEDCPSLRKYRPNDRSKWKVSELDFLSMHLGLTGSSSPANLASRPIRYLLLDETDKYVLENDREAAAEDLAIHRTRTFWNRKIVRTSTPTIENGAIWRAFQAGDQSRYYVPCPFCNEFQRLVTPNIRCDPDYCKNADGVWQFERVRRTAWYECGQCGQPIPNRMKQWMLEAGRWKSDNPEIEMHRSFHLSSIYSPFASWGEMLCEFFKAKESSGKLHDFVNSWEAEPWIQNLRTLAEDDVLAHKLDYPEGTCPEVPYLLVLTADVQENRIYYVVRAWGKHTTSWLVRYGIVETLDDLVTVAQGAYQGPNGPLPIRPENVFVDSGFRTEEIYRFCRHHGYFAIKGEKDRRPWEYPYKKSRQVDRLYLIDSSHFKDELHLKLEVPAGTPGAWNLHARTDVGYAGHLTAEVAKTVKDKNGREKRVWTQIRDRNDWLDCESYQLFVALLRNVRDFEATLRRPRGPGRVEPQHQGGPGGW